MRRRRVDHHKNVVVTTAAALFDQQIAGGSGRRTGGAIQANNNPGKSPDELRGQAGRYKSTGASLSAVGTELSVRGALVFPSANYSSQNNFLRYTR